VISPLGAGLIYVTATSRILYAMSRIGYVPQFLSKLNHQRFPIWAILVNFILGMLAFLPLPGWQSMVNFLVSAIVITYAMGPIALMSLRLSLPDKERPFRLPAARFLCLLAFYCCNLFSYWTGWATISKLGIVLAIGLILFTIAYLRGAVKIKTSGLLSATWIVPYLLGIVGISYLGAFEGQNIIPFGWDFLIIGLFSVGIYYLAIKNRAVLNNEQVAAFLDSEAMALEHG
jgi:amino acid transporter